MEARPNFRRASISLLTHTKRTYKWIPPHLSPTPVDTYKHTPTHMYTSTLFLVLYFSISSSEKLLFFFNQILFSINIENCPRILKGKVLCGCYFIHIYINKSKPVLLIHYSWEAGTAIGTGSCLLSLPVFLFQCCLESAAQRLLKAESWLLAYNSLSFLFILLKCA